MSDPIDEPTSPPTTGPVPSRARVAAALGARIVTGSVAVAVAVGAIAIAGLLPLPTASSRPQPVVVTPVPSTPQLVCPGALLQLGDDFGQNATSLNPIGQPELATGAASGSPSLTPLAFSDAPAGTPGSPTLLTGTASDGVAGLAGAQYQAVDHGDYRGLAVARCARPSSDTWLLGGATTVGRTTLLILANPGVLASTVSIELYGEEGLVDAPGTSGITVPANSQRAISLAAFAPTLDSVAVHVTSRGGPVAASLQESIVRGIEPGGVDLVGATTAPSGLNVIPGVTVFNAEATESRLGEDGFSDLQAILRIVVPGSEAVQATVNLVPESADAVGASFDLTLDPGVVTDVPIEGLTDGGYTVVVSSSGDVAAAMRVSTVSESRVGSRPAGTSDVAWFASASQLTGEVYTTIAPGAGGALHVSNPGDGDATITLEALGGAATSVRVPAGASIAVAAATGVTYRVSGGAGLYASVSFVAPGRVASYVVGAASAPEAAVTIYP